MVCLGLEAVILKTNFSNGESYEQLNLVFSNVSSGFLFALSLVYLFVAFYKGRFCITTDPKM